MPAVSTALVTDKNAYNDGGPADDAMSTFAGDIIANLTGIHGALDDDLAAAMLTACSMVAPEGGLPECLGQEVAPGVSVVSLVLPDTLSINGASASGFPNGRRLQDPVMDVTLAIILLDLTIHEATALVGVLNPTTNDLGVEGAFLNAFPFLHPAHEADL